MGRGELNVLERKVVYHGQYVFKEGDNGDRAYIVQDGRIEIVKRRSDGTEVVIGEIGPGGIFGEMALVDDQPRMASARVATQSTLLIVNRQQFLAKLTRADPFIRALLKIFVRNIRQISDAMY